MDKDNKRQTKPMLVIGSQNSKTKRYICEPRDEVLIQLLGAYHSHSVEFTTTQVSNLAKWLSLDPDEVMVKSSDGPLEEFQKAGNWRNISRYAHAHGLRLMGFLAGRGLLEEGKDPVESLAEMLYEYLEEPFHNNEAEDESFVENDNNFISGKVE